MNVPFDVIVGTIRSYGHKLNKLPSGQYRTFGVCHGGENNPTMLRIDPAATNDGAILFCEKCERDTYDRVLAALNIDPKDYEDRPPVKAMPTNKTSDGEILGAIRKHIDENKPEHIDYEIKDTAGVLIATHRKTRMKDGKKRFSWSTPRSFSDLGGLSSTDLPLYGAEHVRSWDDGAACFLTEGEGAAQHLIDHGWNALGTVCGASSTPSEESLSPLLAHPVYLWPDNDDMGDKHMNDIGKALVKMGHKEVFWFAPMTGPKEDAADADLSVVDLGSWVKHKATEFVHREFVDWFDTLAMKIPPADWIVKGMMARNQLSLLHAPPKAGKSTVAWSIFAAMSRGETTWAGFLLPKEPTRVLYMTEEPLPIIKDKAHMHDVASDGFVRVMLGEDHHSLNSLDQVVDKANLLADNFEADLVVIDTFAFWARFDGEDENKSGAMQGALRKIRKLLRADRGVLVVHHSKKATHGTADVVGGARGSSAIIGAVENAMILWKPETQDSQAEDSDESDVSEPRRLIKGMGRMMEHQISEWIQWNEVTKRFEQGEAPRRGKKPSMSDGLTKQNLLQSVRELHERSVLVGDPLVFGLGKISAEFREMFGKPVGKDRAKRFLDEIVIEGRLGYRVAGRTNSGWHIPLKTDSQESPGPELPI